MLVECRNEPGHRETKGRSGGVACEAGLLRALATRTPCSEFAGKVRPQRREMSIWGKSLHRTGDPSDLTEEEILGRILSIVHHLQSIQG